MAGTLGDKLLGIPPPGTVLADRYRLDRQIGRGGMGTVFEAYDLALKRQVAVKLLIGQAAENATSRQRFEREARAAAALRHSNIVNIYDVGDEAGQPFLVMELIDGTDLHRFKSGPLDDVLDASIQICHALAHAHAQGMVHRDLKPENVLVTEENGRPVVKVVDLGLALLRHTERITAEGEVTGTVYYMAPEQSVGKIVDGRADLYSLGVMLYELVTGRLPFTGSHLFAILSQHLHAPVVPPRRYCEDLPAVLEALVLRLLAKNPEERYSSALEVAAALEACRGASSRAEESAPNKDDFLALQSLARERLVGRDRLLNKLRQSWATARQGKGGLVLLAGEPGAGKSRLARELVNYVRIIGGETLVGGSYEYEATTPYLPFVEALRRFVHERDNNDLEHFLGEEVLGDVAYDLARLAPEIESRLGTFGRTHRP